jgi:hypothetical protein
LPQLPALASPQELADESQLLEQLSAELQESEVLAQDASPPPPELSIEA